MSGQIYSFADARVKFLQQIRHREAFSVGFTQLASAPFSTYDGHKDGQPESKLNPMLSAMPSMLRHNGVWEGAYRVVDVAGKTIDNHQSRIEVRFPENEAYHYLQRNHFWWADGKEFRGEYPGVCRDGMLHWDTPLIRGHAWSIDDLSSALTWRRHDTPGAYLYELIVINEANNRRSRTWHWFRDGVLYQRTLIDEQRVAD